MRPNRLYFGDCLDVLREDVPDESVDLIYLDPPFNSKRLYNAYIGGAQWVAFEDTWRWHEAVEDFHAVAGDVDLGRMMEGLRQILGEGPNLGIPVIHGEPAPGVPAGVEADRQYLPALRPNHESLLEGRHGRSVW